MSWGAIKLRYRDSKNVFFDGEASPAPGGGSMPMQKITVGFADIVDRLSDGNGWAPLFDATADTFVLAVSSVVTEAFDDSQAAQTPQVVDDQNQLNAGGQLFSALGTIDPTGAPPRTVFAASNESGLLAIDAQTIWMFVSPWGFDGAAGSIDLYVLALTA